MMMEIYDTLYIIISFEKLLHFSKFVRMYRQFSKLEVSEGRIPDVKI